ncbi:hypothetical protein C7M84_008701 [Penaeus vannamei]|uniref:Uncharacterized protein n=1 Tax=Penaeus vannamei TaxID=6689 RepID=A0A423T904_PENVA|nr:hypothetical protein C7M84_008701 [Penaeus vannamei]
MKKARGSSSLDYFPKLRPFPRPVHKRAPDPHGFHSRLKRSREGCNDEVARFNFLVVFIHDGGDGNATPTQIPASISYTRAYHPSVPVQLYFPAVPVRSSETHRLPQDKAARVRRFGACESSGNSPCRPGPTVFVDAFLQESAASTLSCLLAATEAQRQVIRENGNRRASPPLPARPPCHCFNPPCPGCDTPILPILTIRFKR